MDLLQHSQKLAITGIMSVTIETLVQAHPLPSSTPDPWRHSFSNPPLHNLLLVVAVGSIRSPRPTICAEPLTNKRMATDLEFLRYPIGKFTRPAAQSLEERAASIASIARLPAALATAVAGLNDSQLDTPYREGGWSVRQLIHHVADSHINAYSRFRLAMTEDFPAIKPYDEKLWAELPDASAAPIELSLSLLQALHARWVLLLNSLTANNFEIRGYHHPAMGRQRLGEVLALYDWHGRHHTAHILNLRARQGW